MLFAGEQNREDLILEVQLIQVYLHLPQPVSSLTRREMLAEKAEGAPGPAFPTRTDPVCWAWEASVHCAILHILSHCRSQLPDPHKIIWPAKTVEIETGQNPLHLKWPSGGALLPKRCTSTSFVPLQWIYSVGKIWFCMPAYLDRHLYRMH